MNERRIEYLLKKLYKHIDKAMKLTIPQITPSGKAAGDKWYGGMVKKYEK